MSGKSETAPGVQQRTLDTRRRILDAAVEALVGWGYSGATTLRIQELAGVSRGRLLHHYPSRDALLVAAVQHLASARIADLGNQAPWPADARRRISVAVETMWSTFQQPYFWASMELWLAARHSPALRAELLPYERELGALSRRACETVYGPELAAHPGFRDLVDLLFSSMRGVAMTYALDAHDAATDPYLARWKRLAVTVLLDGAVAAR